MRVGVLSLLFSRRWPRHSRQGILPTLGRSPMIAANVFVKVLDRITAVQGAAVDLLVLRLSTGNAGKRGRFDVVRLAIATAPLSDRLTRVQLASWQPVSAGTATVAVERRALYNAELPYVSVSDDHRSLLALTKGCSVD